MRFGLNTFLVSTGFSDADIPLIQEFKSYGADVIELAIVDVSGITASKVVDALKTANMERPIVCGAMVPGRDLRGTAEEQQHSIQFISELIVLAEQLGSKVVCGPFYSETGHADRYSAEEREAQLNLITENLKPLCKQAEAAGLIIAIEPLNRFETDCINTLAQATDLIERVGSPALKIHVDTFHMNIEEADSAAAIMAAADHIGHVHASASHRGLIGEDQVDWSSVLAALKAIHYQGDIVIESFTSDNEVLAKATSIWRKLYDSPRQISVEGIQFLQETWKSL
ncbi:MAG TPA: xylose isomerase [Opitutae bacterium]|nr:xylose isomerase [Opitutae bacterium]